MGLAHAADCCTLRIMSDVESLQRVKSLVAKVALDAVLAEARADEFVVVRRGSLFHMEVMASRSETDWSQLGEPTTRLREALSGPGDFVAHHLMEDGRHCLRVKVEHTDGPLAASIVRSEPFAEPGLDILVRLIRSILLAGEDLRTEPPLVIVEVEAHPAGFRSTVEIDRIDSKPTMAINSDAVVATATAATALAESNIVLRFAAQTSLEDGIVSIVLVEADDGGPIFGVSLDKGTGASGPVAAVFRAADFVEVSELTLV